MISDEDFKRLVAYMRQEAGIDFSKKRILVTTRLENYLEENGYNSLGDYLNLAIANDKGKEAETLINYLTTNHTFFWRESKHFEFLEENVLPEMKKRCEATKDLRIWCAASSSGEEPYTLAMILDDFFGLEHRLWDTTVLATDISTKVLNMAVNGQYDADSIVDLPGKWQLKYFRRSGDVVTVSDEIKKGVLFRRLNLIEPFPFKKKLHIVFCRNVLIYFDDEIKKKIVDKIVDSLEEGGYLFVGSTESLSKSSDRLEYVIPSVYRKVTRKG